MNRSIKICAAAFLAAAIVALVVISGLKNRTKTEYNRNTIVMGTAASFTVYALDGDRIIDELVSAEDTLDRDVISWRSEESELYRLNEGYMPDTGYEVSGELYGVISDTLALSEESGGLLDITIRPLSDVWGIEEGSTAIPSEESIKEAMTHVDVSKVSCYEGCVYISAPDMSIDLGAVGKGYGCDVAAKLLNESDCYGACIALGGSIYVCGSKPDGEDWKVGVKNPRSENGDAMGILSIPKDREAFISTSGDYEKYFIKDNVRYHHILDAKTGYPADKGVIGATVVCDNGLMSDGLSTLCMLMDIDEALMLVKKMGADVILIDSEKNVYVSEGIRDYFTITDDEYNIVN